jgi:hypothetical protein
MNGRRIFYFNKKNELYLFFTLVLDNANKLYPLTEKDPSKNYLIGVFFDDKAINNSDWSM